MDGHALCDFECGKIGIGIVIALAARDHMHVAPMACQMKCKIGQDLTRRGVIWEEIPVDEDEAANGEPRLRTIRRAPARGSAAVENPRASSPRSLRSGIRAPSQHPLRITRA